MVYAMKSVSVRQSASHDDVRTRRHDCTVLVSISKLAITTSTRSSSSSSSDAVVQRIAYHRFTPSTSETRQVANVRVEAFLRRGVRSGLRPSRQTADEITDNADDKLYDYVLRNDDHVLHELLLSALTSPITCEHVVMTERSRRRSDI